MLAAVAAACAVAALGAGSAAAATIFGNVSDEVTHLGIAGVEVCLRPPIFDDCALTDSSGGYSIGEIPAGQYLLYFSAGGNNLPFVSEFYEDKSSSFDADPITLSSSETRQVDAELARGGAISGTLTDEDDGKPVANMAACASGQGDSSERCVRSDSNGQYQINGLPSGEYVVEYESWNQANYLEELYDNTSVLAQATRVTVAAPGTTTGIDAELAKGAQISGHVSQASTGLPMPEVFVCAQQSAPGEHSQCDMTDADGNYALLALPAGTYLVAFEPQHAWFSPAAAQWWRGAATREEATPIVIAPPEAVTGIDGQIGEPAPAQGAAPATAATVVPPPLLRPRLSKCRKGFHRKLVKGKKRCVRVHRRHHGHHRRHR